MSFSSTTTLLLVVSYFITLIISRVIHVAGFRGTDISSFVSASLVFNLLLCLVSQIHLWILYFIVFPLSFFFWCKITGVDSGNPVVHVNPSPLTGNSFIHGSKEVVLCERVQVSSISRLNLGSYASSIRVTLSPSVAIPERLYNKIQVCFHRYVMTF